jgi:PAS domain S-box-containing protein
MTGEMVNPSGGNHGHKPKASEAPGRNRLTLVLAGILAIAAGLAVLVGWLFGVAVLIAYVVVIFIGLVLGFAWTLNRLEARQTLALEARIAEVRQESNALEGSEKRYRRLFEAARDGILILDADTGKIVDVNPFMVELTGYSRENFLGKHVWEIGPFQDTADARDTFDRLQTEKYVRYEDLPLKTRNGRIVDVEVVSNVYLIDGGEVIQCNIRDISARKAADMALMTTTASLRKAQSIARIGSWTLEPSGRILWSDQTFRVFGVSPGTFVPTNESMMKLIHPGDRPAMQEWLGTWMAGKEVGALDFRTILPDGSVRYLTGRAEPVSSVEAGSVGFSGTVQDITERKLGQEALQLSEERFRILFEQAADCILVLESLPDGIPVIRDANRAASEILGYERSELIGQPITFLDVDPGSSMAFGERLRNAPPEAGISFEVRRPCKDGRILEFECSLREIRISEKTLSISVERDVTQRKWTEANSREHQKLESIGTLASGVAHEINNPLNVVLNYGQLIMDNPEDLAQARDFAGQIIKESRRMAVIVSNLLNFSRRETETHNSANIGDIVDRTLSLVQMLLRKDQITIQCDIPAGLPLIMCRSQQIQQVLMNLLTNARDALNDRYPKASPDKTIRILAVPCEKDGEVMVRLTVEDHGSGIRAEVADRVFDPFYTTKGRDKGTGLGLSISRGIMREHKGSISFQTEPGRGTRFHVDLPVDPEWSHPDLAFLQAADIA